jgi:hypothetical protein
LQHTLAFGVDMQLEVSVDDQAKAKVVLDHGETSLAIASMDSV